MSRPERRLAAILVADVVGYSRLMGLAETATLTRIKKCRHELLEPLVALYHGRLVAFQGDNALCEFSSIVEAVDCAVRFQDELEDQQRNLYEPIRFRIGVHLADIVADGDHVNGDGVNIAARLEQICEPGGVTISGTAYDYLKGKMKYSLEFVGERRLKNIADPVRVYRVTRGGKYPRVNPKSIRDQPSRCFRSQI